MAQNFYDNQMLRRYLLGAARADETARLDELSLTDDACALALAQAENDLVDAYANASLTAAERAQFERHYLASPARREKAQLAQALQGFGERAALPQMVAAAPRATASTSASWIEWLNLTPLWQAGLATAAVLLVAACVWLGWENRRLREQSSAERIALAQREAELKNAAAQSQEELARVSEKLAALPTPAPLPAVPATQLFTFTLAAPVRGATALPSLKLPPNAAAVTVRLELETNDYPRYRAALRDPLTNRIVWQSGKLTAQGKVLTMRLPSKLFAAQRYAFELSGVAANGGEERLSSYPFSVVKP